MPDVNYHDRFADSDGQSLSDTTLDPRLEGKPLSAFADTLKLSNTSNFVGQNLVVVGASENAIDMNRNCRNVLINDAVLSRGDHCAVVIKGGCSNIALKNVSIRDVVSPYDIELGGWSDQSQAPVSQVLLENVTRSDGNFVNVVVGNSERPTVIGGKVRVLLIRSLTLKAFVLLKRLIK